MPSLSVGNSNSENGEKLCINTNNLNMTNTTEKHKNKPDCELTNEKDELRKNTQVTKRYKNYLERKSNSMKNDDASNENHVEHKSNNMKNDDAPKSMSETYASILKKGL